MVIAARDYTGRLRSPLGTLVEQAQRRPSVKAAIVDPLDPLSLGGALSAAERGLIRPILVGDEAAILETANRLQWSVRGCDFAPAERGSEAATAAHLAAAGETDMIVKGALHSDVLLHAVLDEPRLLSGLRLSHIVVTELPERETPVLLSDGAVNIQPDLDTKAKIVQNAIDAARRLGIAEPRVAILAAVETVVSSMNATLDAAALSEMAERGQITGGIVDGPLALDDAISPQSASAKGIRSAVAGYADILISPDLQAGNILYKAFDVLLRARFAAVVTGAKVPIVFTSRGDSIDSRILSCAVARLLLEE